MRAIILVIYFIVVFLITGCSQETFPSNETALLSFTEFFCYMTETSKPFAYFQFAYQENGEIKYVKTKTTCEDLIKISATNDRNKNPDIFGEQITLYFKGQKPVKIIRENGDVYDVETSEQIRNFFTSGINAYDNLEYSRNSNPEKVVAECLLISDSNQHDRCLSFQAAFQQDVTLCDKMVVPSNQDLCEQWIQNIKEGKIND